MSSCKSSLRCILTRPQFELLRRLDNAEFGETRLAHGRDRAVAERLEVIDCAKRGEEKWWSITDHGRNILDLHRRFFEEADDA
jgi:hypothetical protein